MSLSTLNPNPNPNPNPNLSSQSSSSSTKGNGNAQACAACKYQRRKCAPDCLLAPYFPHDSQRQFLHAHRLFGVSNITKIIKQLHEPGARDDAMRTIIFQSDARAVDPVGGCYQIIRELQRQIELVKVELDFLNHHLAIYRAASNGNEACHYFQPQDDVSQWVVQDLVDVKSFDQRDEGMLRSVVDEAVVLKEEDFCIQQGNGVADDDLRDAATMFTLTS